MPALTTSAKMKANTAKPSTIAAGATDRPKISGFSLKALIAAATARPCQIAV